MGQINATSLKRKLLDSTVFFIRKIALCQFPPWEIAVPRRITPNPYIIIKNIQTLLARSVYKRQVHRVLILSIWNKYEKLFQVKLLVNRLRTTVDRIRNSEHASTVIIYYIFKNKPLRRCSMWGIPVKQLTSNYCRKVEICNFQ